MGTSVRGETGGVYFPPGVYKITSELTITRAGVWPGSTLQTINAPSWCK